MSGRPKTIQIFLPGDDPRGSRVAEIAARIVWMKERTQLTSYSPLGQAWMFAARDQLVLRVKGRRTKIRDAVKRQARIRRQR